MLFQINFQNIKDVKKMGKFAMQAARSKISTEISRFIENLNQHNSHDEKFKWKDEKGYWIGEYSFFGDDGNPRFDQDYWNYRYDHYTGFIVGAVEGNKCLL